MAGQADSGFRLSGKKKYKYNGGKGREESQGDDMNPGIYYVIFKAQSGRFGDGLVVVDKGKVHGGDQRYLYRGSYKTDGQALEADIQVSYYRGEAKSVLGHLAKFKLNLTGKSTGEAFTVSGHVFGQSHLAITIEGQKQADLIA